MYDVGYAHMSIKPSNIFVDDDGNFMLGDLGSVARFERSTCSTKAYVPRDVYSENMTSDAEVDWWMLALTFCLRPTRHRYHAALALALTLTSLII